MSSLILVYTILVISLYSNSCYVCLLQCISATYYGLFDGHAGHTVSLIASKLLHMLVKVSSYTIWGAQWLSW